MRKKMSFRIMVPLLLILVLTLLVNVTVTQKLQGVRTTMEELLQGSEEMSDAVRNTLMSDVEDINNSLSTNGLISTGQLLMVITTIFITLFTIVRPLQKVKVQLDGIVEDMENNRGDLSIRMSTKLRDEIGSLVGGVNLMLDKLEGVMKNIRDYSVSIDDSSERISGAVSGSIQISGEVSDKSMEIRNEIQRITDEIHTISENMDILQNNNTTTSELSVSGREYAVEMKQRATNIEEMVQKSKRASENITGNLKEELVAALEESKSVNNIQSLINDILNVTSQTNLLALNASIEAARAGEAGRGFSVVADEIRNLSDNSKQTVEKIQEISNVIITSVNKLADSSSKLLDYISKDVMEDYDKFVATSKEYLADADKIEGMMINLNNSAKESLGLSDKVSGELNDISVTADRENDKVIELAESIDAVAGNIGEIQSLAQVNVGVSESLKKEIGKFRAI
ncbi:MAG: methyl-accepting chemotaxis protein [Lachnospiraceae bacterium]|nr:methyl-accepting chemotaxis protein [Lachnospiraceae bacterium]MBP3611081.1 methyl-accepting chemotaxis protein [Lachnospiraceae bacterium]